MAESDHTYVSPFTDGLPIRLIATPRDRLVMCSLEMNVSQISQEILSEYDHVPVTDSQGRILGVLETHELGKDGRTKRVADVMKPLHEGNFIGAESPLIHFIWEADEVTFRFVVDGDGLVGLVTVSDLQKLPVRAALFALVTQLEMSMAQRIGRRFSDGSWKARLSGKRQREIRTRIRKAEAADSRVDDLVYTYLSDKVSILGPEFGDEFNEQMSPILDLRNDLAHAKDIAEDRRAAKSLAATARFARDWIRHLNGRA